MKEVKEVKESKDEPEVKVEERRKRVHQVCRVAFWIPR